ncbi:LmbE-like protein [Rickenella mellea]|uniref:N-acetylglucosaminylphosphatidylinositol deacetylase n=1 Tax=Rickenella mellea TaxID=50990 RepID=A0A4Y7PVZ4_9AGAM|nr:LmbE-like protein [Rickenella mellea]
MGKNSKSSSNSSKTAPQASPPAGSARATNDSILSIPLILIFILVPILSLLWTPEAPPRPFALLRPKSAQDTPKLITPRILLVTAHPDDEVIFAPTVLALLSAGDDGKAKAGYAGGGAVEKPVLWSVCLSMGDYGDDDGDESAMVSAREKRGDVREAEWEKSWDVLGLKEEMRYILDVPTLRDNISAEWDPQEIANQVEPFIIKKSINTILTFDHSGVTNHPNHRSLPHGIEHMLTSPSPSLAAYLRKPGTIAPRLFTLKTVPWYQHGTLSPVFTHLSLGARMLLRMARSPSPSQNSMGTGPGMIDIPNTIFISDIKRYIRAWRALLQHRTQMGPRMIALAAWGKYVWVNEWVESVL